MIKPWKLYFDELYGNVCQCGNRKKPKMSFCPSCYYRLPLEMREALYRLFCGGYREAYDAAVEYLSK